MRIVLILLFLGLLWLSISLQKSYAAVSAKELKRRARKGDSLATGLYKAVSYGPSLRAILWLLIGASGAAFFVSVALWLPVSQALIVSLLVIWLSFVWLPSGKVSRFSHSVASSLAPAFAWLLNFIHPIINRLIRLIRRFRPLHIHTGLYEVDDLLELFKRQQVQADNRIAQTELDIARHALQFGKLTVHDVLTPRRVVKMVKADEAVGPVLMTELHASGLSRFPVYETKKDNLVGVLYLRDLVTAKQIGTVRTIMQSSVCYIHEEQALADALQAVLKTHQQLLIVVNSFEEYVGVLALEDILEQIIGKPIIDEFDQYHDMRAVAARDAKLEHEQHTEAATEVESTTEENVGNITEA